MKTLSGSPSIIVLAILVYQVTNLPVIACYAIHDIDVSYSRASATLTVAAVLVVALI